MSLVSPRLIEPKTALHVVILAPRGSREQKPGCQEGRGEDRVSLTYDAMMSALPLKTR